MQHSERLHCQKLLQANHHDGQTRIKIQPQGSTKYWSVNRPGKVGFQGSVGKHEEGGPSQDDRVVKSALGLQGSVLVLNIHLHQKV